MSMLRMLCGGTALAAAVVLSGCGGDDSGGSRTAVTINDLVGNTYVSTTVTGQDLVEGSSVQVAFDEETMAVSAGCNTMTSAYQVTVGTLAWSGQPAATAMACSDELMAQDQWLTQYFSDGLQASLDGDTLTLTGDEITMELAPSQ